MARVIVVNALTRAQHIIDIPVAVKVCGLCPKDEVVIIGPQGVLAEYSPRAAGCARVEIPHFDSQTVYVGALAYLFARGLITPQDVAKCGAPAQYGYQTATAAIIGTVQDYVLSFYSGCPPGACTSPSSYANVYGFRPYNMPILKIVRIEYQRYEGGACTPHTEWPTDVWEWLFWQNTAGFKDYLIPRINQAVLCIRRDNEIIACTNAPLWNGVVTYYVT